MALTGNIASGKSAVAGVWAGLGAHIIDADELARRAVEPGSAGLANVARAFGPGILTGDGTLDRAELRRRVFDDAGSRRTLESLLHPEIARLRVEAERQLEQAGTGIVVHVIPLLFETGMQREFDDVVLVDAPESTRLHRLMAGRGLSETEARAMIAAQMPAGRKRPGATIVIENDGTLEQLESRARAAWHALEGRA